jgi:hypothetical protein
MVAPPFDQPQFQVACYCGAQPGEPCIGTCGEPDCQSEVCQWRKGRYLAGESFHAGGARELAKREADAQAADRDARARGWPSAKAEYEAEAIARGWELEQ